MNATDVALLVAVVLIAVYPLTYMVLKTYFQFKVRYVCELLEIMRHVNIHTSAGKEG